MPLTNQRTICVGENMQIPDKQACNGRTREQVKEEEKVGKVMKMEQKTEKHGVKIR